MKLHKKSIVKTTAFTSIALLLSKCMGIAREFIQVSYLGVGPLSDAFNTAFKIPTILRKIFAEGALSAAFVPTIIKVMRQDSESQASKLFTLTGLIFGVLILALCVIVSLFPEPVIYFCAPGFYTKPEEMLTAISLIRILIYFVFFIFWSALLAGALQSKMHFAIPSWGPAILNVFYIGGLLFGIYFGLSDDTLA
jgi:putative peptidoglycan lipid II flippase